MADEFKTLLRVDGDASGAKKAAEETKTAAQSVGAVEQQAAAQTAEATKKTAVAVEEKAAQTEKAKEGFAGLAEKMGTSQRAAMAFREAVSRISPELGALLDVGFKFTDIMNFGLSKLGMVIGGVTAGIGLMILAFQKVDEAVKKAERGLEQFAQAQERVQAGARAFQAQVVESAAAAGQGPAALGGARALAKRLEERGVTAETATAVAPYLVDEQGRDEVAEQQAMRIAAAVQAGIIEAPTGYTPRAREAWRRRATRQVISPSRAVAVENAAATLEAQRAERMQAMAQGQAGDDLAAWIAQETGLAGAELDERVAAVRTRLREGPRMGVAVGGEKVATNVKAFERLGWEGKAVPLDDEITDVLVRTVRRRAEQAQAKEAEAGERPIVINNYSYNHGTINNGRPNSQPVERIRVP